MARTPHARRGPPHCSRKRSRSGKQPAATQDGCKRQCCELERASADDRLMFHAAIAAYPHAAFEVRGGGCAGAPSGRRPGSRHDAGRALRRREINVSPAPVVCLPVAPPTDTARLARATLALHPRPRRRAPGARCPRRRLAGVRGVARAAPRMGTSSPARPSLKRSSREAVLEFAHALMAAGWRSRRGAQQDGTRRHPASHRTSASPPGSALGPSGPCATSGAVTPGRHEAVSAECLLQRHHPLVAANFRRCRDQCLGAATTTPRSASFPAPSSHSRARLALDLNSSRKPAQQSSLASLTARARTGLHRPAAGLLDMSGAGRLRRHPADAGPRREPMGPRSPLAARGG